MYSTITSRVCIHTANIIAAISLIYSVCSRIGRRGYTISERPINNIYCLMISKIKYTEAQSIQKFAFIN